jgi:NAD(P)-dependent dehydrogenase (short-subunit alcohol dehydrogenase family)
MSKKIALIIGGNGGIGCSATKQLAKDEFQVCATYFNNKNKVKKVQSDYDIRTYQCNVTDESEVGKMIDGIATCFGNIDVVVFTMTSSLKNSRILDLEWEDYYEHFNLQIKTMLFTMKALGRQISSKYKTKFIVLLTEYCVGTPPKGLSHYVTSKYAAMGMAKTMAVELAQFDCTVNMISPGMVVTPLLNNLPSKLIEMTAYNNPLKRNAIPEDISNLISFLASDKSDYLNGTNIVINGGGVLI